MAGILLTDRPDAASPRIRDCVVEFHVTSPNGLLSSPELLLQALRREVLPALPQVLESPPLDLADIHVPSVEIDLGEWPDDPDWADLRAVLAHKLRLALMPHLGRAGASPDPDGIASILAMSPAELRRYLAIHPAMATNISRWRDGAAAEGGINSALSPAQGARLDDLMRAALAPVRDTSARQRLVRHLWRLPPGRDDDPDQMIAALCGEWPGLFEQARDELASAREREALDRMAAADAAAGRVLRDVRAMLVALLTDAGIARGDATVRAGRLAAAMALRIGPMTLAKAVRPHEAGSAPKPRDDRAGAARSGLAPAETRATAGLSSSAMSTLTQRVPGRRGADPALSPITGLHADDPQAGATGAMIATDGEGSRKDDPTTAGAGHALPVPGRRSRDDSTAKAGDSAADAPSRHDGRDGAEEPAGDLTHGPGDGSRHGGLTGLTATADQPGETSPGAAHRSPSAAGSSPLDTPGNGGDAAGGSTAGDDGHHRVVLPLSGMADGRPPGLAGTTDQTRSGAGKRSDRVLTDARPDPSGTAGPTPDRQPGPRDKRPDGSRINDRPKVHPDEVDGHDLPVDAETAATLPEPTGQRSVAKAGSGAAEILAGTTNGDSSPPETAQGHAGLTDDIGGPYRPDNEGRAEHRSSQAAFGPADALPGAPAGGGAGLTGHIAGPYRRDNERGAERQASKAAFDPADALTDAPAGGGAIGKVAGSGEPIGAAADQPQSDTIPGPDEPLLSTEDEDRSFHPARTDASRQHPETERDAGGQAASWAAALRSATVNLADLRRHAEQAPDIMDAALSRLETRDLLALVQRLLPSGADLLGKAIGDLVDGLDAPKPALRHVLKNLLDRTEIDLDRAKDAARHTAPAPAAPVDAEAGRVGRDLAKGGQTARQAALGTLMRLVGIAEAVIERLLGADGDGGVGGGLATDHSATDRSVANPPGSPDSVPDPGAEAAPRNPQDPAAPYRVAPDHTTDGEPDHEDPLDALLDAGLDPAGQDLRVSLDLILSAWPGGGATDNGAAVPATDLRQRRLWLVLLERLLDHAGATATRDLPAVTLEAALTRIEPDEAARTRALRYVAARIGYGPATADPVLRQRTSRLIATVLRSDQSKDGPTAISPAPEPANPKGDDLLVTESAGVILLHPFMRPLFDRLGALTPQATVKVAALPRALAALRTLDGRPSGRGLDPLHRLLLGLPEGAPPPEAEALDEAARDLIEGLLRSVIGHWKRLGKTSPDGLRETFLQRPGTLRFDDTGAHLRVTPGPFDMLMDGLPWSLGVVALPWMAVPCHVRWRDRDE